MDARATARPLKLAIAIALLCAGVATPCSFDSEPMLFFTVRPDAPIERYVEGQLGILQPGYARSHLVIAFRHLSGRPPSPVERQGFLELLRHRLGEYPEEQVLPQETWERLRTSVRGVEYKNYPDSSRVLDDEEYTWIDNCTGDAFTTAVETLNARVQTFGAKSAAVAAWLDAQELVFGNCSDGDVSVPDAEESLPAIIRADRSYQKAAAHFYAMRYDDAHEGFYTLANDAKSPYRDVSRLLAVRTLIRATTVASEDHLQQAQDELREILADRGMKRYHESAWGLLAYTVALRAPQQRFDDAARALLAGAPSARHARTELGDYTTLWEREGVTPGNDELTDWIRTFQNGDVAHALERWKATKGTPWLVAALTHAKPTDAAAEKLLQDSANITPRSPAYAHVAYHRVRLMRDEAAAHAELDRALAAALPVSARNQFFEQRRFIARSLQEYLRHTPVTIVGEGFEPTHGKYTENLLPPDAAVVINYWMPVEMMAAAAKDESLPELLRSQIGGAAELRAALLQKPDFDLAYESAQRTYYRPVVRPFNRQTERVHWWCPFYHYATEDGVKPPRPSFLPDNDAEMEKLNDLGSGASWLLRTTLERARTHPDDPRVPEALALAIEGTRWACGDEETDALAEKAFGVLKRRYAKTKWAKQTKYWYRAGS
ncbi:MAG TPA: hypothetical protein VEO54_18465 [Thermoanaerobaculia bacterium]|nr:hypothetical protein [Thermoanaerobaculia bacterium]